MKFTTIGWLMLALAPLPARASDPWLMFHHDERHTGLASGTGNIPDSGPVKRWDIPIAEGSTESGVSTYRWYSGFPLVDLDQDGILDIVVTGPDSVTSPNPGPIPTGRVHGIHTTGQTSAAEFGWSPFPGAPTTEEWGCSDWFDQYSSACVNCDSDPAPDIVFTAKGGRVRAVSGRTGAVIWSYDTSRFIEAGPMVADLDRDGIAEIIVVTGLPVSTHCTPLGPALLVFRSIPALPGGDNPPIQTIEFPNKLDSEEPAIVDLNPPGGTNSKTIVFGSWGGLLYALWFDLSGGDHSVASGVARQSSISMIDVAPPGTEGGVLVTEQPIIRSSPLVYDFGQGETAVFAWMGDFTNIESSRISAVRLAYDAVAQRVNFTPLWTHQRVIINGQHWPVMDWKPSIALLPMPSGETWVVTAGGKGENTGSQTGDYGVCTSDARGFVGAFRANGDLAWGNTYVGEGNIRASCAVADLMPDADGLRHYETLVAFGCTGLLRCFRDDGTEAWSYQLGVRPGTPWTQRSIGSPSVGDVDGDGSLEILASSFDGYLTCLGSPVELGCRGGNVNAGPGPVTNVLFANGSAGDGLDRQLVVNRLAPFTLRMDAPPSRPGGPSPLALYAWIGQPTAATVRALPARLGFSCMPTPLSRGSSPQPRFIANNIGLPNRLGTENWPGPPTQPAPSVLLNAPNGVRLAGTFFLQGYVVDSSALNGRAAVTNGIVIVSQ